MQHMERTGYLGSQQDEQHSAREYYKQKQLEEPETIYLFSFGELEWVVIGCAFQESS
jgi:hypothetical protein